MKTKEIIKYFVVIICLAAIFFSGFFIGEYWKKQSFEKTRQRLQEYSGQIDLSLFWEAWDYLHQKYLEKDKLNTEKLIYGAISGMINAVGDPYNSYLDPKQTKEFEEEMKGEYQGVGMVISKKNNQIVVISPLQDSPAQRAGILAGDIILKIDGKDTSFMTTEEAASLIKGPKGTKVILSIYREEWQEAKEFQLIRETIKIPNLKTTKISDGIIRIEIYQFNETLPRDFKRVVEGILSDSSIKKIILDLRNNPGGYLNVAEEIAGYFLKKNDIILIEDYGKTKEIHKAQGNGQLFDYPLVVLINQGTASGGEILAGALKDNKNITLIGERTFGKGSVQEAITLSDGSLLKITIAKWLTPKGHSITDEGIKPDIEIKITDQDYKEKKDPQLEKAIEIIKNL